MSCDQKKPDGIILYKDKYELIANLNDEQRGKLLLALFEFAFDERVNTELDAITNIVFNEKIADSILAMKNAKNEDDEKKAADAFQSATINEAMKLLDVVTYVPSDMASGILGVLDSFMTSSGK